VTQLELVLERIEQDARFDAFVQRRTGHLRRPGSGVAVAGLYHPCELGFARCSVFQRLTLEDVVAALLLVDGRGRVEQFQNRHIAQDKAKRA
jgi:hypothetical protein